MFSKKAIKFRKKIHKLSKDQSMLKQPGVYVKGDSNRFC